MAITRKANTIFIATVTSAVLAITVGTSAQAGPDARSLTIEFTPSPENGVSAQTLSMG